MQPPVILKGCRWLVHAMLEVREQFTPGHIVWWHYEPDVKAECGREYLFLGWSPKGSMPQFVDADSGEYQIAGTVIRTRKAIDRLCPRCRAAYDNLVIAGLVVPFTPRFYHPETVEKYKDQ